MGGSDYCQAQLVEKMCTVAFNLKMALHLRPSFQTWITFFQPMFRVTSHGVVTRKVLRCYCFPLRAKNFHNTRLPPSCPRPESGLRIWSQHFLSLSCFHFHVRRGACERVAPAFSLSLSVFLSLLNPCMQYYSVISTFCSCQYFWPLNMPWM